MQDITMENSASTSSDDSTSAMRATKRKLEDVIHSLDEAVGSPTLSQSAERPSPAKKQHRVRSLYAALSKYGIKTTGSKASSENSFMSPDISKAAPHLAAILARSASRSRNAPPLKPLHVSSADASPNLASEYRPSSIQAFLARLATFKLSTYANKPSAIDAVAAAKCGWVNDGKDRLVCGICSVSWVVAGREGMNKDAANALVEKQRVSLVEMHKDGCPWKTRQCDSSIYRISLQSPAAMAREIKSHALTLEPLLHDVEIRHPLSNAQLNSLRSTILSVTGTISELPENETLSAQSDASNTSQTVQRPSDAAILTSLFGWTLAPRPPERQRTTSLSRANSLAPSALTSPSPSRAPSVSRAADRAETPTPISAAPALQSGSTPPHIAKLSDLGHKRDTSLLHCILCQRRVGLWAFAPQKPRGAPPSAPTAESSGPLSPQRQFDLLKEHRSYCPYVVRSTFLPSPPVAAPATPSRNSSSSTPTHLSSSGGAMEGWRAVLTVVLRHGLAQRQRMSLVRSLSERAVDGSVEGQPEDQTDMQGVEAMVAGVKSHGGKELLRYVKGLLG